MNLAGGWPLSLIAFELPAAAGDALRLENVQAVARLANVTDQRFAYDRDGARASYHVSCSHQMALCLVEALNLRAGLPTSSRDVVIACADAVAAIFAAVERAIHAS